MSVEAKSSILIEKTTQGDELHALHRVTYTIESEVSGGDRITLIQMAKLKIAIAFYLPCSPSLRPQTTVPA
jgi:hypothetical protein